MEDKLDQAIQTHPELRLIIAGVGLLTLGALVSMAVTLWNANRRGALAVGQVPPLKIPGTDALLLLFVLVNVMLIPVGNWLFFGCTIVGVLWVLRHRGIDPLVQWGSGRLPLPRLAAFAVWIYLATMGVVAPLSWVIETLARYFHWSNAPQETVDVLLKCNDPAQLAWLLFTAILLAPASEEILFRGFIQPLFKANMPAWGAWVLTALIFATIHFHTMTFMQLLALGLALGAAYEITGSLPLCIALHMCFNGVTACWLLYLKWWL